MRLLLCALAIFVSCSALAQDVVATGTILDDDTAGDSNLSAEWTSTCALASTIWCVGFDSSGDVTDFRRGGDVSGQCDPTGTSTDAALLTYQAGSAPRSSGFLRIEDTTAGDNQVYWARNFDPTDTTCSIDETGFRTTGEPIFVRFFLRVNTARLDGFVDGAGSGLKIVSLTSANNTNTEQEGLVMRNSGRKYLSSSNSNASVPWYFTDIGGGDFDMQPGSSYGACHYSAEPTGCKLTTADQWDAYVYEIVPGTPATADTVVRIYLAEKAGQTGGDTAWHLLYERTDNKSDGWDACCAHGYSGVLLWNRAEDHDPQSSGQYHDFKDVVLSTELPPVPGSVAAPAWFTDEPENRWQEIPGTSAGDLLAANGSLPANAESYSGMAVDGDDLWFSGGGHALQSNNSVYRLPLLAETTAWERVMTGNTSGTPCTGGVADCTTNGTGAYNDGSRASDHTYNTHVGVTGDCSYFGIMGSAYLLGAPGTFVSSAVWKWCLADIANGESGYTYLGKPLGSLSGYTTVQSSATWDESAGRVYVLPLEGSLGWYIDDSTDAITTFSNYTGQGSGAFITSVSVIPTLGVLAVATDDNTIQTTPLSSPGTWTTRTVSGTFNSGNRVYPLIYSPVANQLFGREPGDGTSIRMCQVPAAVGSTWACSTVAAASGGVNPGDPDESDAGPHTRFNVIPDFGGSGCDMLVYWPDPDEAVYFQRICGPRS